MLFPGSDHLVGAENDHTAEDSAASFESGNGCQSETGGEGQSETGNGCQSERRSLDPRSIILDKNLWGRSGVRDAIVKQYGEQLLKQAAMPSGPKIPPPVVFHDEETGGFYGADGWHTILAAINVGIEHLEVEVRSGGRQDALLYSLQANRGHGLARSNKDKNRAVELALNNEELGKLSDRDIAKLVGVSHTMVSNVRARREGPKGTTRSPEQKEIDTLLQQVAQLEKVLKEAHHTLQRLQQYGPFVRDEIKGKLEQPLSQLFQAYCLLIAGLPPEIGEA